MTSQNFYRILTVAVFALSVACAQATIPNISQDFVTTPTGPSLPVAIKLTLSNYVGNIREYSFRVDYDATQLTFVSATDNTGQAGSGVFYVPTGPTAGGGIGTSDTHMDILMHAPFTDIVNPGNLAQLNFTTTAGYTGAVPVLGNFNVTDSNTLLDSTMTNVPHSYSTTLPVAVSAWSAE